MIAKSDKSVYLCKSWSSSGIYVHLRENVRSNFTLCSYKMFKNYPMVLFCGNNLWVPFLSTIAYKFVCLFDCLYLCIHACMCVHVCVCVCVTVSVCKCMIHVYICAPVQISLCELHV